MILLLVEIYTFASTHLAIVSKIDMQTKSERAHNIYVMMRRSDYNYCML